MDALNLHKRCGIAQGTEVGGAIVVSVLLAPDKSADRPFHRPRP